MYAFAPGMGNLHLPTYLRVQVKKKKKIGRNQDIWLLLMNLSWHSSTEVGGTEIVAPTLEVASAPKDVIRNPYMYTD